MELRTNFTGNSLNNWFERSDLAENYEKYRPHYDRSMYEQILEFCGQCFGFQTQLAVDVGNVFAQCVIFKLNYFV